MDKISKRRTLVEYILVIQVLLIHSAYAQVKLNDFMSEFKDFAAKTRKGKNLLYFENLDIDYEQFMKYHGLSDLKSEIFCYFISKNIGVNKTKRTSFKRLHKLKQG